MTYEDLRFYRSIARSKRIFCAAERSSWREYGCYLGRVRYISCELYTCKRPSNFEALISLNSFKEIDGTAENTLYSQIVHVKSDHDLSRGQPSSSEGESGPFFFVNFENNPLDGVLGKLLM